jgi:hypothetical protein
LSRATPDRSASTPSVMLAKINKGERRSAKASQKGRQTTSIDRKLST